MRGWSGNREGPFSADGGTASRVVDYVCERFDVAPEFYRVFAAMAFTPETRARGVGHPALARD